MILWLNEIQNTSKHNKINYLSELYNNNFPVPNAFILPSSTHKHFLKEKQKLINITTPSISPEIKKEILENQQKLNKENNPISKIKNIDFINSKKPLPYLAIRSPASTYLNIKSPNTIIKAIEKIYTQIEEPSEIIVQQMINPDKSAITEIEDNQITIKAIYGIGQIIKKINHNTYKLNKKTLEVKNKITKKQEYIYTRDDYLQKTIRTKVPETLINQQTLTDTEIREIAFLTNKINNFLNKNLEIEFAIEKNKIYIINLKEKISLKTTKINQTLVNLNIPENKTDVLLSLNSALKAHPEKYLDEYNLESYKNEIHISLEPIIEDLKEKKILISLTNLVSNRYKNLQGFELKQKELNPLLGWHGIRRLLDQKQLLKAELEIISNLNKYNNITLVIPFISSLEQLKQVKELTSLPLGVQIDTPASATLIEEFCKEKICLVLINFHSLTQLTLGIDKKNPKTNELYDELHSSLIKTIENIIETCKNNKIEIHAKTSNKETAEFLKKQNIDSIIVNSHRFEEISTLIT